MKNELWTRHPVVVTFAVIIAVGAFVSGVILEVMLQGQSPAGLALLALSAFVFFVLAIWRRQFRRGVDRS